MLYIDPDGQKKLKFSLTGGVTSGKIGVEAKIFGFGLKFDLDLGSVAKYGSVYLELDDETGEVKLGATLERKNTKAGSVGITLGYINIEGSEYTSETSEVNTYDGKVPKKKENVKEEGGALGPFGVKEKRKNGTTTEERKMDTKGSVGINALFIGVEVKAEVELTEDK